MSKMTVSPYGVIPALSLRLAKRSSGWFVGAQAILMAIGLLLAAKALEEPFVVITKAEVWWLVIAPAFFSCIQIEMILLLVARLIYGTGKRYRVVGMLLWSFGVLCLLSYASCTYIDDIAKFQAQFNNR